MVMDSESIASTAEPPERRRLLPRFPTGWVSESALAEAAFARLLWLLVPLQYLVFIIMPGGLARDDVMATVMISLLSVVAIFLLSCAIAVLVSVVRPIDPESGDTFSRRVRMWVVGLMVCTTASYLLLVAVLGVGYGYEHWCDCRVYGDLVTGGFRWLARAIGPELPGLGGWLPSVLGKLTYAFGAVYLILFAYRKLQSNAERIVNVQEPNVIAIGGIVAAIMTAADFAATFVGPGP